MSSVEFRIWTGHQMIDHDALIVFTKLITSIGGLFIPVKSDLYRVMQSTGLTDKNNQKIFEGDVIDQGDNFNSIVRFGHHDETIGFHLEEISCMNGETEPRIHSLFAYTTIPEQCEVIGNIYENPELLEEA